MKRCMICEDHMHEDKDHACGECVEGLQEQASTLERKLAASQSMLTKAMGELRECRADLTRVQALYTAELERTQAVLDALGARAGERVDHAAQRVKGELAAANKLIDKCNADCLEYMRERDEAARQEREECAALFDARAQEWRELYIRTSMDDAVANSSFKGAMEREMENAKAIRARGRVGQ